MRTSLIATACLVTLGCSASPGTTDDDEALTAPTCSVAGKIPPACPDYATYSKFVRETPGRDALTSAAPCGTWRGEITIALGQDPQAAINAAATGSSVCFKAGKHRLTGALSPQSGQILRGEPGAILSGAIDITSGWTHKGTVWTRHVILPNAPQKSGLPRGLTCEDDVANTCVHAEDVFVDGVQPRRVGSASAVKAGEYFVAYDGGDAVDVTVGTLGKTIEIATEPFAIDVSQPNVTLRHLVVEDFATPADNGAITLHASGILVDQLEARNNHAAGIKHYASGTTIQQSWFHHNGQLGIFSSGATGGVVTHNEFDHDNADLFLTTDGAAGGIKISSDSLTVEYNFVHDNKNRGIWVDSGASAITIAGNLVQDNYSNGIMYEISSGANIHHNTVLRNALENPKGRQDPGCTALACGGGIVLNNVSQACVYANTLTGNMNGVSVIEKYRQSTTPVNRTRNVTIYDNHVDLASPLSNVAETGLVFTPSAQDPSSDPYASASHNVWYRNSYTSTSSGAHQYMWKRSLQTEQTWTKTFAEDACGSFR
jgi:parallel beta-helix repeat protein